MNRKIALGSLLVFGAGLAYAADQTILGNTFLVKNPSTAAKRKVIGKAKEPGSPNTIVGNPTVTGGTLVITASGGTPSAQPFALPQGTSITGKPFWKSAAIGIRRIRRVPHNSRATAMNRIVSRMNVPVTATP